MKTKNTRPEINVNPYERLPLPDFEFDHLMKIANTPRTILFDDGILTRSSSQSFAMGIIPKYALNIVKDQFYLSKDQFYKFAETLIPNYIKREAELYDSVSLDSLDELFGILAIFARTNPSELFNAETVIFVLEEIKKTNFIKDCYPTQALGLRELFDNVCPSFQLLCFSQTVWKDKDTYELKREDHKVDLSKVSQYIMDNYKEFLVQVVDYAEDGRVIGHLLLPVFQRYLTFPVEFVEEHTDIFSPIVFVSNEDNGPEFGEILYGKMTENFVNTVYEALSPDIPKITRSKEDILLSLIS